MKFLMSMLLFLELASVANAQLKVIKETKFKDVNFEASTGVISNGGRLACVGTSFSSENISSTFLDRLLAEVELGSVTNGSSDKRFYYSGKLLWDAKREPTDVHVYFGLGFQDIIQNKTARPLVFIAQICTEGYFPTIPWLDLKIGLQSDVKGLFNAQLGVYIDLDTRHDED